MDALSVAIDELARQHGHIEDVWARRLYHVSRQQLRLDLPLCQSCVDSA